jgi:hypothetical protein
VTFHGHNVTRAGKIFAGRTCAQVNGNAVRVEETGGAMVYGLLLSLK